MVGIINGERARWSLDTRILSIATERAKEKLLEIQTGCSPRGLTVADAIDEYFSDKMATSFEGEKTRKEAIAESDTFRKYNDLLSQLQTFCETNKLSYLQEVTLEHLIEFLKTWRGRLDRAPYCNNPIHRDCCSVCDKCNQPIRKEVSGHADRCDGRGEYLPKSLVGKQKYQETLRAFFNYAAKRKWIDANPAADLSPITVKNNHRNRTPHPSGTIQQLLGEIDQTFPRIAPMVRAFFLVLCSTALRIGDVVTLRRDAVEGDKIMVAEMGKTGVPVYTRLPPIALEALHAFKPKSDSFFFWSGNGKIDSWKSDWSGHMLKLYRAVGATQRNHAWRDTLCTKVLGQKGGKGMETASALLGHGDQGITNKFYTHWDADRQELLDIALEKSWEQQGLITVSAASSDQTSKRLAKLVQKAISSGRGQEAMEILAGMFGTDQTP
jgi:integrase